MFPSLGLFKSIQCPLYPHCVREQCLFSHNKPSSPDRPTQTVKRQLPETSSTLQKEDLKRIRPNPQKTSAISASTSIPKEATPKNLQVRAPVSALSAHRANLQKTTSTASSLEPTKRTVHASNSTTENIKPPIVLPNMKSIIPIKTRQIVTDKLFECYKRIYAPILSQVPEIATESTIKQEEIILLSTTNLNGYKQKAASILGNLKKRPASTGPNDVGIDGEWEDPATMKKALNISDKAIKYVLTLEKMKEMCYPLPDLLSSTSMVSGTSIGSSILCDRCKSAYVLKDILNKNDSEACLYHSQKMRTVVVNGERKRIHNCCSDAQESNGCTRGPHVYKEEDVALLHSKIPFILTPPRHPNEAKCKLVALDCEMGYTTAGMELIRLTVVNEQKEKILDELVLPSHMVVDLNTQFSGVKTLEGVKHDLVSLRKELFKYIDEDTVILGHGLENDMKALRLIHKNIVDTVDLYPHKAGLPYRNSLRYLSSTQANKIIQQGSDGHDSMEDAIICIDLLTEYIKKNGKN